MGKVTVTPIKVTAVHCADCGSLLLTTGIQEPQFCPKCDSKNITSSSGEGVIRHEPAQEGE